MTISTIFIPDMKLRKDATQVYEPNPFHDE
jgi:hypothetical protein